MKIRQKKGIVRKLSCCVIDKFNGFAIVRIEKDREICKIFYPINIIYKPVKKLNENIECFISAEMHLAYGGTFNVGEKIKHTTAGKCHCCARHFENCAGQPGIIYDFNVQIL